jgi:hypothetical protein
LMGFDVINIGATANDGTGDPLRTAFDKTNDNFALAVEGPAAATSGRVAVYDGATGKLLRDGTKAEADLVVGPASATAAAVAAFDGTTGKLIEDGQSLQVTAGKFSPTANTVAGNGMYLPAANTVAFSTDGAERLRVTSAGALQLPSGSPGIVFNAGSGGTSKALADYEEGTFTPELVPETGSFTSITYGSRSGNYTKIGNIVRFTMVVPTSALNVTGASGGVKFSGLPFTAISNEAISWTGARMATNVPQGYGLVVAAQTFVYLHKQATGAGDITLVNVTDLNTATASNRNLITISGVYRTS